MEIDVSVSYSTAAESAARVMELNQIFIIIVAFLGLILGAFLIFSALEEYKPGKKGFKWLKRAILFILLIALLYHAKVYLWIFIGAIVGFLASIFIKEYFFLGLALFLSFLISKELMLFVAALIFIFGLPYGSLELRFFKTRKNILVYKIFWSFVIYLIPFYLLLAMNFVQNNLSLFLGLAGGAFLNFILKN